MDNAEKIESEKVANIIVHTCDQGHYGSAWCGNCNTKLPDNIGGTFPRYCPSCGIRLEKFVPDGANFGGSDF